MTTQTTAPAELKPSEQKALTALAEHSGATAAQIAEYAGIGGSTAGKALTKLESLNLAYREHGEKDGARKVADRWYHRPVEAEPEGPVADEAPALGADAADTAPEAAEAAQEAPAAEAAAGAPATTTRLARGGLRQMVYEHLAAHPADEVTAPRLAKVLGRSAGAVANALAKLKDQGQADLVGESPRRYRLAGQ
ncbi:TrmB family transcriptional regulator [Streptomyces ipomoeae]|uniref:TrmB family transcriptional regulator n=1 Tax=Streptomyces ipomoeae TaxID=103232 RepID=UPI0011474790|nr:TrmB family transcriptional regulator [Streptomyces ipomoeae]TQE33161.1 hypothetical protein Sipo7851_21965 [Streptomyces ipomoeae]